MGEVGIGKKGRKESGMAEEEMVSVSQFSGLATQDSALTTRFFRDSRWHVICPLALG